MNKVEQILMELYPNYTIQPPINLDFRRAGWEQHPLPSDYLIIPPGFHDDTPTQEVRNWARVIRDDGDLRLSICTFPKVVDTFSGQEVNPGDFATEVFLPESERFTQCSIRKLVKMGPNGENFNKAVNQIMDDASELRTAKRRLEALLEVDTDKLRVSQSANGVVEADFVEVYRDKLQPEPGQKISLSGADHLRIAEEVAAYAIQHKKDFGIDNTDLQLMLEEYAPYGKTTIRLPGTNASSYASFVIGEAEKNLELMKTEEQKNAIRKEAGTSDKVVQSLLKEVALNIKDFCALDPAFPYRDGSIPTPGEKAFITTLQDKLFPLAEKMQGVVMTLDDYLAVDKAVRVAISRSCLQDNIEADIVDYVATWDSRTMNLSFEESQSRAQELVEDTLHQNPSREVAEKLGHDKKKDEER